jgi:hypothetical protein
VKTKDQLEAAAHRSHMRGQALRYRVTVGPEINLTLSQRVRFGVMELQSAIDERNQALALEGVKL